MNSQLKYLKMLFRVQLEKNEFPITYGNMKRLPNKTFHNIDAVSGNCFILLVIAS